MPTLIVTGFSALARSRLIAAWLAQGPAHERWLLLRQKGGAHPGGRPAATSPAYGTRPAGAGPASSAPAMPVPGPSVQERDLGGACACCAGEAVLRTRLPGWLAEADWHRLIIDLPAQGQPARLIDALRRAPFAGGLDPIDVVAVIGGEPGALRAFERLEDPAAPALIQALAQDQIESATRVWCADPAPAAQLVARLADWPPFGREIASGPGAAAGWWATPGSGQSADQDLRPAAPVGGGIVAGTAAAADPIAADRTATDDWPRQCSWHWPAGLRRSRPAFLAWLKELDRPGDRPPGRVWRGAFDSERDSYRLDLPGVGTEAGTKAGTETRTVAGTDPRAGAGSVGGAAYRLVPTAYRGPGRLEVTDPDGLDPIWLERLDRALNDWLAQGLAAGESAAGESAAGAARARPATAAADPVQ